MALLAPLVLAACSSSPPPATTTTTVAPTTTTSSTSTTTSTTTTTTTVPAVPAPATSLQALGAPTVTAACVGASFALATPTAPLTTTSGAKFTSGLQLTGGPCTTTFTWHLNGAYRTWTSFPLLDVADVGNEFLAFASNGAPIAFSANNTTVNQVEVTPPGVHISVPLTGVQSFSIVLPRPASNPGSIDVTSEALVPR